MSIAIKSLHEHFSALAKQRPDKAALIICDEHGTATEQISFQELFKKIEAVAASLQGAGFVNGDRVALSIENSAELLLASWAAWSIGVVTVPLDTKRDTTELSAYKQKTSSTKGLFKKEDIRALCAAKGTQVVEWKGSLSHEALILFTSGTTAYPKGVQLTLENLVVNAQSVIEWLRITEDDRFSVQLPLHHINSTTFCLATLLAGGSIVIPPRYSNSLFFGQLAKTGATYTSIVPSIVFDQLCRKDAYAAVSAQLKLNRIQLGSAPVVASAAAEFIRTFGIPLYQGYGQTETALRVTGVPMGLPEPLYQKLVEENSIGAPLSWAQVEITDDEGLILGEEEEGEVAVKGPAVMQGYLGGESAFRNGYFLTGDVGFYRMMEGYKFFFLKGRKKEIIIKGGINISPVAVENSLKKISTEVDQAYCLGVVDSRYGEEVAAVICFKEGVEAGAAMRHLKFSLLSGTPFLSAYETPKYLLALSAADLPTTSTGKVQRMVLKERTPREWFEQLYELFKTDTRRFEIIEPQSPHARASHELYNHCWQPLVLDAAAYKKYLGEYPTLAAINSDGQLDGQISFSCKEGRLTCVSICSAAYVPKPVPEVRTAPDTATVRTYLLEGLDPVMNFHKKLGAELVEVTPNGRPEDKSTLGYTMLLRYPPMTQTTLPADAPVSAQLIAAVRILAAGAGAEVYAVSRPGGLAAHMAFK